MSKRTIWIWKWKGLPEFQSDWLKHSSNKKNQTYIYTQACSSKEKAMAPHSSTLAWKIPWMEEPGGLQSIGSLRVGHDWATSLSLFTFMHWRGKWQPTPVFLPGESQGWGSLVGCCLWGRTVGHDWSDLAACSSKIPKLQKSTVLIFF